MSTGRQLLGLLGWLVLSFATAAIGAVASSNADVFYQQLAQPSWAPPAWLFGPWQGIPIPCPRVVRNMESTELELPG